LTIGPVRIALRLMTSCSTVSRRRPAVGRGFREVVRGVRMRCRKLARVSAALVWTLCAFMLAACLENPAVTCTNGLICAPGNVCDNAHGGCATTSQVAVCAGKAAEAACSYPSVTEGACYDGVCLPTGCGNGVKAENEACDDGNRMHGDGCSADCLSDETCGNGFVDVVKQEACDDGNVISGDGCQANCAAPTCGDGVTDEASNEVCDDGADNSDMVADACRTNCQRHFCGDHVTDGDEVCDDGNSTPGDGCFYNCQSKEICGNGYVDTAAGEQCDDANALSHDGCSRCRVEQAMWTPGPSALPQARYDHAMAYDAARGRVVPFGG